jgi:hypothetical protein
MEWGKFLLAVLCAGLASSMTDWFFAGILFHDKYNAYPEVWRHSGGKGETRAVVWSIVLSFFTCAIFIYTAQAFDITGWHKTLLLAILVWGSVSVPLLITNALFIKLHPLVVTSNALGWLAKLVLAASATVFFL